MSLMETYDLKKLSLHEAECCMGKTAKPSSQNKSSHHPNSVTKGKEKT